MSTDPIRKLLSDTDRAAGPPLFGPVTAADLRRRIHRRRCLGLGIPIAAAAVLLLSVGIWAINQRPKEPVSPPADRIASLEAQVQQLQARTEATLQLVHEVLAQERQQQQRESLETQLANIPDPAEEIKQQEDKTAFVLLYQADKLYQKLNQTESAVEAYEQIIQLFPQNRWAHVARERLAEIKRQRLNKSEMEGDAKCERQRT